MRLIIALVLLLSSSWGRANALPEKQPEWTFEVAYHPVLDAPTALVTGYKRTTRLSYKRSYVANKIIRELPSHFDWREIPGGLSPVKDQKKCGSCWAFSTVAVVESLLRIKNRKPEVLSEQQLISCNRDEWGCHGGDFGFRYYVSPKTAATEDSFPYQGDGVACKTDLTPGASLERWNYIGSRERTPTNRELKSALLQYGPLAVTIAATTSFKAYHSGIYNACDGDELNHMVVLVGWNDDEKVWIIRNSWGEAWGEQGYMRIRYSCNKIASEATFAILTDNP